jgi:hypothetical protein
VFVMFNVLTLLRGKQRWGILVFINDVHIFIF